MYTLYIYQGTVVRDSDQKVIAPTTSAEDQDFHDYIDWVNQGNQPTMVDTIDDGT